MAKQKKSQQLSEPSLNQPDDDANELMKFPTLSVRLGIGND